MSDVPWALGRRAMVLTSRGWRECEGMAAGRHRGWVWTCPSRNFIGEPSTTEVFETTRDGEQLPTTLLPDQGPRCYDVGAHADGCMVAANLARGVSAFFAPWVMETPPTAPNASLCYGLLRNGQAIELQWYSRNGVPPAVWEGWETPNRLDAEEIDDIVGYFALGPNGPTLAPWGKP